jgi:hypothetical protein
VPLFFSRAARGKLFAALALRIFAPRFSSGFFRHGKVLLSFFIFKSASLLFRIFHGGESSTHLCLHGFIPRLPPLITFITFLPLFFIPHIENVYLYVNLAL